MTAAESIVSQLLEWHENAALQVAVKKNAGYWSFKFFRNGRLAGQILSVTYEGYVVGCAVSRSLQGTGIGHAMMDFVFTKTNLPKLSLTSSAHAFYHKVGGKRQGISFTIDRNDFKPSRWHFQEIDWDTAEANWNKETEAGRKLMPWPSRN